MIPVQCQNEKCTECWKIVYREALEPCSNCGCKMSMAEVIHLLVPADSRIVFDFHGSSLFNKENVKFVFLCEEARRCYREQRPFTVTAWPGAATCYDCLTAFGARSSTLTEGES